MLSSDEEVNSFNLSQDHQVSFTDQNQATVNKIYVMTLSADNITDIQDQIVVGLEDADMTKHVNLAVALTPENTVAVN
jgi:tRNA U34 5-carboxymethylaminomethyl modifying enzyme MnmG/GidA